MKKVEVIEVKKLGRPVNENSVRQQRIKELEFKKENGLLKRGRPVNENSERQKRLKELESKRELGLVKRGRPKMIKVEEVKNEVVN
jgi:hypothetical protein